MYLPAVLNSDNYDKLPPQQYTKYQYMHTT